MMGSDLYIPQKLHFLPIYAISKCSQLYSTLLLAGRNSVCISLWICCADLTLKFMQPHGNPVSPYHTSTAGAVAVGRRAGSPFSV